MIVQLVVNGECDGPPVPYVPNRTLLSVTRCGYAELEYFGEDGRLELIKPVRQPVMYGDKVSI